MAGEIVHVEFPARDADRATAFYNGLFGWEFRDSGMPGIDYRMFEGQPGGAVFTADSAGDGPIVYFGTDDIDAAIAKVRELGGEAEGKQPIPGVGWFTRVKDPDGNSWSFFQSDESVAPPSAG
jgi:predicted enzyme related to lactoylglutathione lyase